eukprot:1154235-Pelagomonas_calceolata.AAC.1
MPISKPNQPWCEVKGVRLPALSMHCGLPLCDDGKLLVPRGLPVKGGLRKFITLVSANCDILWKAEVPDSATTSVYRVGIEFGHGEMENFNSINFKPKLFIKNIGLEILTCTCK